MANYAALKADYTEHLKHEGEYLPKRAAPRRHPSLSLLLGGNIRRCFSSPAPPSTGLSLPLTRV